MQKCMRCLHVKDIKIIQNVQCMTLIDIYTFTLKPVRNSSDFENYVSSLQEIQYFDRFWSTWQNGVVIKLLEDRT